MVHKIEIRKNKVHPILAKILCIGNCTIDYILEINHQLWSLGVEFVVLEGNLILNNVKILGKGQNSIVVKCKLINSDDVYVCKIKRYDSPRSDLLREASILRFINDFGIGPKIINFSRYVEIMEYIDGVSLSEWINQNPGSESIRRIVKDVLTQAYTLDKLGITHLELSRAHEHLMITRDYKVKILDFETASLRTSKTSLNLVMHALVVGKGRIQQFIRSSLKITDHDIEELKRILSIYKRHRDEEVINKIFKLLRL